MIEDTERDKQLIDQRFSEAGIEWPDDRDKKALAKAAPVFLRLLNEVSSPVTKAKLVRVVSSAKVPPEPFLTMLRELRPAIEAGDKPAINLGWTLGDALWKIRNPSVFDDILEIVGDRRYGTARQMLVTALERFPARREDAIPTLLELVDDKDVILHVIHALGKLKATEAIEPIQRHLASPKPHIRKEARQALAKIAPDLAKTIVPPKPKRKRLGPIPENFEEASTNFDLHGVPPFLEQLSSLVEGFGSTEKEGVQQLLEAMEVEEEAELEFPVVFRGDKVRLRFQLYMCDEGAVDLAVFTVPALSQQIQIAMGDD